MDGTATKCKFSKRAYCTLEISKVMKVSNSNDKNFRKFHQFQGFTQAYKRLGSLKTIPSICNQSSLTYARLVRVYEIELNIIVLKKNLASVLIATKKNLDEMRMLLSSYSVFFIPC